MARRRVNLPVDPNIAPGGARTMSTTHPDAKKYLWTGKILHVDPETMCCSISLSTGSNEFHDVPLPAPGGGGPRSWSGVIPEPGTKVIVGWYKVGSRGHKPVIIEVLTSGVFPAREYEPFASVDPEQAAEALELYPELEDDPHYNWEPIRLKLRKAYSGDFLASSSGGADILLDRDFTSSNRSGNEFKLRDSDQTAILQTINEFTSNAAGYYRRGLIKRNAYTFLQDLFPLTDETIGKAPYDIGEDVLFAQKVPTDSPAFGILREFGLITEDGTRTFDIQDGVVEFPYVVTSDGQRINYVTASDFTEGFDASGFAYVEDRKELRHISNGIMPVTEEGDGFQIDLDKEVFIEDVHGTVVGNDFTTIDGRKTYKKITRMRLFTDPLQGEVSPAPVFEPLDTLEDLKYIDSQALARLYRIQAPNNSNQYAFGINKEGRVFLHVPASQTGTIDDKGKSIDANIQGLLKAVIGKDPNTELSADLVLVGGLNLTIGRGPSGNSINLTLDGPVSRTITNINSAENTPAESLTVDGSCSKTVSGNDFTYVRGNIVRKSGASDTSEASSITHNAGTGGYKLMSAGDLGITVLGQAQENYAQLKYTKLTLGTIKQSVSGIDSNTMLAGSITRTVVAGTGITDTVTAGNMDLTVATGNMNLSVAAGTLNISNASGSLSINAAAGPITLNSSITTTINSGVSTVINTPTTKIGVSVSGNAVAGIPGPPIPHLDYITGIPILGIPTVVIG